LSAVGAIAKATFLMFRRAAGSRHWYQHPSQIVNQSRKNEKALKLLENALITNPNQPSLLYLKAWILSRFG
jgi:hypothetical protein